MRPKKSVQNLPCNGTDHKKAMKTVVSCSFWQSTEMRFTISPAENFVGVVLRPDGSSSIGIYLHSSPWPCWRAWDSSCRWRSWGPFWRRGRAESSCTGVAKKMGQRLRELRKSRKDQKSRNFLMSFSTFPVPVLAVAGGRQNGRDGEDHRVEVAVPCRFVP